ncbi:unnamed protein product [Lathyrus sativus]|nr:unnamed protein product [Lathyrus sativus]
MEGAMDALSKICEDVPQIIDADVSGLAERPINIFLPRLFRFFQSPHASLRKLSLGSVNQYIMLMLSALCVSMDQYLQGLFILANDPTSEVWKLVCATFVQLIEVHPLVLAALLSLNFEILSEIFVNVISELIHPGVLLVLPQVRILKSKLDRSVRTLIMSSMDQTLSWH